MTSTGIAGLSVVITALLFHTETSLELVLVLNFTATSILAAVTTSLTKIARILAEFRVSVLAN